MDGSGAYMDGDYYPGAVRLNEGQAKYLYNQFAKQYFERYPGNVPEPLEFDAKRYDELWSMPEANLLGIKSRDRRRRLDEVKVLVIEYFIQGGRQQQEPESDAGGAAKKVRDTVREMLGVEPGENPLDQYLEDMPTFPAPPAAPGLTQTEASDLAELASALASTGGLERRWLAGDARARLESAVIDLDLKVSAYEALPDAASAGDGTAADALQDIEQKQSQVAARHAELLALAADDRELTAAVDAELGERMGELTAWQPERAAGTTWRWYGPDAATGAPPVS